MSQLNPEIKQTPAVLSFNYETFKAELEQKLEQYRTVVTVDTVKQAKETATELNKLKTELDTRRKEAIRYVSAPIKAADDQMKECVRLVADGRQDILDQVARFDKERLEKLHEKLIEDRDIMRSELEIRPEFHGAASDLTDLVKLGNITPKGRPTGKAGDAVYERVNQEHQLQLTVERRILELENASYRAGLAAPLTKAHVEHFIRADEETYQAKLGELFKAEIERDRQSRQAIAQEAERQAQAKPELAPEPDDAGLTGDIGHGGYAPKAETEPKPQAAPAGNSVMFFITVTMSAQLPTGMTEAQVEQQFRAFIEQSGNTTVDFITVERDADEARDVT